MTSQTFLDVIKDHNKKLALSEKICTKVLVWTEDYEKAFFCIYDNIPNEADYFWLNRLGTYLYKFERSSTKWEMIEKSDSIEHLTWKKIPTGPAFDHVQPILKPHEYVSWF